MSEGYYTNAKINLHSREAIQPLTLAYIELSKCFKINEKDVAKWRNREYSVEKG